MEEPNFTYIEELSGGDAQFKEKLLSIVKIEFPVEVSVYEENINNAAFIKAAENVHKLKHKFGILGLEKGYQVAIDYEENLKIGSTQLQGEFEDILKKISLFISTL